jgi:V/A-type H+-transporting ATPase subunit I
MIRAEKYKVIGKVLHSEHVFILTGYIPAKAVSHIETVLKEYDVEIDTEDVLENEDAPVVLKNNSFSSPLEGIIESFSLPEKEK